MESSRTSIVFTVHSPAFLMKEFLSPDVYSNFLDLSVAVRLLLCPSLVEQYVDHAQKLLKYFVESFVRQFIWERPVSVQYSFTDTFSWWCKAFRGSRQCACISKCMRVSSGSWRNWFADHNHHMCTDCAALYLKEKLEAACLLKRKRKALINVQLTYRYCN